MKQRELACELARKTGITRAEAADRVGHLVNDILQKLRSGEPASLPGFGEFRRASDGKIEFCKEQSFEKS